MPFPLNSPILATGAALTDDELEASLDYTPSPLDLYRRTQALAAQFGIPTDGKTASDIIETAQRLSGLSRQYGTMIRVGDPLPNQPPSHLRTYADYFQDVNKLVSPNAMGIGGGYSYRGMDPFASKEGDSQ